MVKYYFLRRLPNHASEYDYIFEKAMAESLVEAPDINLMLLSWLAREMARAATPLAKKNRDAAIQRLDLDQSKLTREEIEVALARDYEYTFGQVLRGASLLFVELLGYVFYRSLGNPHTHRAAILSGGTANRLKVEFDLESVVSMLETDDFEPNDAISVIWKTFLYIVENLVYGPWGDSYRAAPVKFRFLLSQETRRRFTVEFDRIDEFLQKREVPRTWAAGISERQGLYDFISSSLQA